MFDVGTRFVAFEVNATYRPSSEISCAPAELFSPLLRSPGAPVWVSLTIAVVPATMSRRKTSTVPFVSPSTTSLLAEAKATNRPSAETVGAKPPATLGRPVFATVTSTVVPAVRS